MINKELADKLGISEGDRQQINDLHIEGDKLIEVMSNNKPDTMEFWRALANWRITQSQLQGLWEFNSDSSMWQEYKNIPYCTCPKLDNKDVGHHIYFSGDCPVHFQK